MHIATRHYDIAKDEDLPATAIDCQDLIPALRDTVGIHAFAVEKKGHTLITVTAYEDREAAELFRRNPVALVEERNQQRPTQQGKPWPLRGKPVTVEALDEAKPVKKTRNV